MLLNGKRLTLRKSIDADLDFLYSVASDKEIWTFSEEVETGDKLRCILVDRIHSNDSHNFVIQLNDDKQTSIGTMNIWVYHKKHRIWEISYAIFPAYRNKGYCIEALHILMNFAFYELNAHKVVGTCNEYNIGSSAVMEKIGMTKEAIFRERLYWNNQWTDQFYYGILEHEYKN